MHTHSVTLFALILWIYCCTAPVLFVITDHYQVTTVLKIYYLTTYNIPKLLLFTNKAIYKNYKFKI